MSATITRIAARLQAHSHNIQAAFSEEQISFLQKILLPEIEEALPTELNPTKAAKELMGNAAVQPGRGGARGLEKFSPAGNSLAQAVAYLRLVRETLKAVAGRGSPAARAAGLKTAVREQRWSKLKPQSAMRAIPTLMKRVPTNQLTPKGKELLKFLTSQHFKLLGKSWNWIIRECENEFGEIMKSAGLVMLQKRGLSAESVFKSMQKLPELKGWKFSTKPANPNGLPGLYAISPDGLNQIEVEGAEVAKWRGDEIEFALKPSYAMKPGGPWTSWARTGVDSGAIYFEGDYKSLNLAVEECLEQIAKDRERRATLQSSGEVIDFGPTRRTYMPEDAKKVIDILKSGRAFSIDPPGFGTAYRFSTTRSQNSSPASQELSTKVGKPVYYTSFDMD